jgi:HEAT repeat protein
MSYLTTELSSPSSVERRRARVALTELGNEAIPALVRALSDVSPLVRQEAVKALEAIGNDTSAQGLIQALQDQNLGVRWLAAEALAHLGPTGLHPLLTALVRDDTLIWLREGAHHVLHFYTGDLNRPLEQLMNALEDNDATAPLAWDARVALESLPTLAIRPNNTRERH